MEGEKNEKKIKKIFSQFPSFDAILLQLLNKTKDTKFLVFYLKNQKSWQLLKILSKATLGLLTANTNILLS